MRSFSNHLRGLVDRALRPTVDRQIASALLHQPLIDGGTHRVTVAASAEVNNALFNTASGAISVGEFAFFGFNVTLLTGTHDVTRFGRERQLAVPKGGRDIVIEEGAWLATNVTVIGPSIVGAHAVVAAGAVVRGDVRPYTVVAGVPAVEVGNVGDSVSPD